MESLSIHPRNWKDGNRVVKDTSKPKGKHAKKLDRKLAWLNARQRDREATIKQPNVKNPMAFKMPGSMNQRA
jgi:transcriptional accessory protein Tex/SPT6